MFCRAHKGSGWVDILLRTERDQKERKNRRREVVLLLKIFHQQLFYLLGRLVHFLKNAFLIVALGLGR